MHVSAFKQLLQLARHILQVKVVTSSQMFSGGESKHTSRKRTCDGWQLVHLVYFYEHVRHD